jgi:hypothetical protein
MSFAFHNLDPKEDVTTEGTEVRRGTDLKEDTDIQTMRLISGHV